MTHVREMTEADVDAVSAIRVGGWRHAYAGIVPASYLAAMSVEEDALRRRALLRRPDRPGTDLVAVGADGTVTGWACVGSYRGGPPGPDAGELYALYVRPDLMGTGIGRTLLATAESRAADQGHGTLLLWVLADNTRARHFYETAGYTADGAVQHADYGPTELPELRYHRPLHPAPAAPATGAVNPGNG